MCKFRIYNVKYIIYFLYLEYILIYSVNLVCKVRIYSIHPKKQSSTRCPVYYDLLDYDVSHTFLDSFFKDERSTMLSYINCTNVLTPIITSNVKL